MKRHFSHLVVALSVLIAATACSSDPDEPQSDPSDKPNSGEQDGPNASDGKKDSSDSGSDATIGKHKVSKTPPSCEDHPNQTDSSGVSPGILSAPFPTQENLSLVWTYDDDENTNAHSLVRFREEGGTWLDGGVLYQAPGDAREGFAWDSRFAGSLMGLDAGTTYEVEVQMLDEDGGCAIESLKVSTREVPKAASDAEVVTVTPSNSSTALGSAKAGQLLEFSAGDYGEIGLSADGTQAAPIVLRGAPGAHIEGDVRLDGRSHIIFENFEVQGKIKFNGGNDITVRGCTIETLGDGIITYARSENATITDNTITGSTTWNESALGVNGDNLGEGIAVTGPGHIIANNNVRGFRDAISLLEDDAAVDQFSIDILRNEVSGGADDGIEADFCFHNCRIIENRITNSFMALSSQPGLGGPTYFVRNVVFQCGSIGIQAAKRECGRHSGAQYGRQEWGRPRYLHRRRFLGSGPAQQPLDRWTRGRVWGLVKRRGACPFSRLGRFVLFNRS